MSTNAGGAARSRRMATEGQTQTPDANRSDSGNAEGNAPHAIRRQLAKLESSLTNAIQRLSYANRDGNLNIEDLRSELHNQHTALSQLIGKDMKSSPSANELKHSQDCAVKKLPDGSRAWEIAMKRQFA